MGDACEYGKGQCEASSTSLRASGLTCSPTTGKCTPRPADESCATAGTCDGLGCFEGLGCNPLMVGPMKPGKTSLVLGPLGSACGREGTSCEASAWCKGAGADPSLDPGTCTAPFGPSEKCTDYASCGHFGRCIKVEAGLRCESGRPVCN